MKVVKCLAAEQYENKRIKIYDYRFIILSLMYQLWNKRQNHQMKIY